MNRCSFPERTPDAYTTQFNSGEFKVGGAGTLLTVAIADTRGVKVKYLFNLVDYWGAVVTSRDNVKTLKDLEGKQIAAARSTTNYKMFEFFAKQQGVDISKFQVVNTAPPGLMSYAIADRAFRTRRSKMNRPPGWSTRAMRANRGRSPRGRRAPGSR